MGVLGPINTCMLANIDDDVRNAMETIPVKILEFFIKRTVMEKPASREASSELIEINTISKGEEKCSRFSPN